MGFGPLQLKLQLLPSSLWTASSCHGTEQKREGKGSRERGGERERKVSPDVPWNALELMNGGNLSRAIRIAAKPYVSGSLGKKISSSVAKRSVTSGRLGSFKAKSSSSSGTSLSRASLGAARKSSAMCIATSTGAGTAAKGEAQAEQKPTAIYLKDYTEYPYSIEDIFMEFHLGEEKTTVHTICRMSSKSGQSVPMVLNGEEVELKGLYVNGKGLIEGEDYSVDSKSLVIKAPPAEPFTLGCITDIEPQNNTSLNGLYKSGGNFCSQCEAEGFRCITYYPDRPDVMTKFTVKIVGDKEKYPVLLSNGNLVAEGDLEGGKHYAVWVDPWKKPAYLFALVAGQYVALEDKFVTKSGRAVDLRIYTAAHNSSKTQHAMDR